MANRSGSDTDEYAGTGTEDDGVIDGPSAPVEPSTVDGSGSGSDTGSGSNGTEFDPAIHVDRNKRNADGSYTRRKGRKSGTSTGSRSSSSNLKGTVEGFSHSLVLFSTILATATKIEEIAIDKEEGDLLAKATTNFLAEFEVKPNPKVTAAINLGVAVGMVVGPRIMIYRMRKSQQVKEEQPNVAGVYDANGFPAGTTTFNQV